MVSFFFKLLQENKNRIINLVIWLVKYHYNKLFKNSIQVCIDKLNILISIQSKLRFFIRFC